MIRQAERMKEKERKTMVSFRVSETEYSRLVAESQARGDTAMAAIIRDYLSPVLSGETAKQREAGGSNA